MANDLENTVGIVDDLEIKTPVSVYARLPDVVGFVVFLRVERRVMEVLFKEFYLLDKGLRHLGRRGVQ